MTFRRTPAVVVAEAACRADLAGGTLDIWPLHLFHPGSVTVNMALSIGVSCRVTARDDGRIELISRDARRHEIHENLASLLASKRHAHPLAAQMIRHFVPEEGLTMETDSASPAGAGISGSSALMIAGCAALARFVGRRLTGEALRQTAQNIEAQLIGVPTGCQDYYPALYGGVNAIHLGVEGVRREKLPVDAAELNRRFLLAYTGKPHNSGVNNWEVFQLRVNGDKKVARNFELIARIAADMRSALAAADWPAVASLLNDEWRQRRTNAPSITTPFIDALIRDARKHGALAAKVCGAGGGGCVLFQCEPERRAETAGLLAQSGAQLLDFQLEERGVRVRSREA